MGRTLTMEERTHGLPSTYNAGCRCTPCMNSHKRSLKLAKERTPYKGEGAQECQCGPDAIISDGNCLKCGKSPPRV